MIATRRNLGFACAIALAAFCGCRTCEPRGPETLGTLPRDLPLPPGFFLADGENSWLEGEGDAARVHIALSGSHPPAAVYDFFRGHMLLARWKPAPEGAEPGLLSFSKGGRLARIRVTKADRGTAVVVDVESGKVEEKS